MVEPPGRVVETRPGTGFFPCIDGIRALTTTAVVLHHTAAISGGFDNPALGGFYARTELAVPIFFVISGFVIYRPFALAHIGGRSSPSGGRFLERRFMRVFPAYWLALLGTVLVLENFRVHGTKSWFLYGSLTYIYSGGHQLAPIQPAWTVAVELTFYLAIPAYGWIVTRRARAPRRQTGVELIGIATMSVLSVAYRVVVLSGDHSLWEMRLRWLPGWLDMAGAGMLLAVVSAAEAEGVLRLPRWFDKKQALWVCFSAAALLFVIASKGAGLPTDRFEYSATQYMLVQAFDVAIALLVVTPVALGRQDQGAARRFLRWRPIAYVGGISYGVYLWHLPLILEFYERRHLLPNTGHLPELFAVVLAGSIACAAVSYHFVERPARRLVRTRAAS